MRRIINAQTGEETQIPLTQQELDEAAARQVIVNAENAQRAEDEKDVTKVPKMLKAIALWVGDLHGLTPAQVKAQVKAKFESLP